MFSATNNADCSAPFILHYLDYVIPVVSISKLRHEKACHFMYLTRSAVQPQKSFFGFTQWILFYLNGNPNRFFTTRLSFYLKTGICLRSPVMRKPILLMSTIRVQIRHLCSLINCTSVISDKLNFYITW